MKKNILIVSHALEVGGAEKSLIGLLDAIDTELYNVDLFLLKHQGELMNMIPKKINLISEIPSYTVLGRPMKDTLKEGHIWLTTMRLVGKILAALYNKKNKYTDSIVSLEYSHKYTCPFMKKIQPDKKYDLAISFLTPHYFVAKKVKAKKKLAWIHTDYSKVQVNRKSEYKIWNAYDHVVSISDAVTDAFIEIFPGLTDKILKIENILPQKMILEQAEEFDASKEFSKDGINLLSIGRFCMAKNFDNIPDICKRLVEKGLNVYWYIIGFGGDENLIRARIKEAGMENRIIILGKKENPYPYIKACDLYVQPSRYEGQCVTVREAQMLGKPVIITRYTTSASQLKENIDGIIVELDNEKCAKGIAELICRSDKMEELANVCKEGDYSNSDEIVKIYEMLN